MKKQILLTITFIGLCHLISAQNFNEGIQTEHTFSSGKSPALHIRFDKVSKDNIKDAATDIFKKYNSKLSDVKGIDDEYMIADFTLKENQKVSKGKMKILESDGNTDLYIYFKNHESEISEQLTPNEINHYKSLTKRIANKAVIYAYNNLVKKQEKEIKEENKKLKNLEKKEENEHKTIGKSKVDIKNSEQEIEQLKTSLTAKELSIAKNDDLLKAKETEIAGKSVKSLNSNISEVKKENKSIHKSIGKHKESIAEIKGEIAILNSSLKGNETEKLNLKSSENIDKKARKRLKTLNKEGLKTIGQIEENKVLIAKEESNIVSLEEGIKTNLAKIDLLQAEIADHNEEALEEQLSLLEKETKRLNQDKKSLEKKIRKANESINVNNEKIRSSEENIKELKTSQEKQKTKIKESEKKLNETKSTMKEYE